MAITRPKIQAGGWKGLSGRMAGDWIKVEHATPDKPEIDQIARLLDIDPDASFGKCMRLWIWADQQSVDGNDLGVTQMLVDRITFCPGFADALRKVGWLSGREGRLSIPNFSRHNGQTAKNRAQTADRVAKLRNAPNVTKALPEKRREEKRRNKGAALLSKSSISTLGFSGFWEVVHRKVGKRKAEKAFSQAVKAVMAEHSLSRDDAVGYITARMQRFRESPQARDDVKGNIHPATWLNEGRYDDDPAVWQCAADTSETEKLRRAKAARKRQSAELRAALERERLQAERERAESV